MHRAYGIVITLLLANPVAGQFPPERATNLRILPSGIAMDSLIDLMSGFTRALGVRCGFCHVQREGQSFDQIDFSLDDNPRKAVAREMLTMAATINREHLARLGSRRREDIVVTCMTCHRGVAEPRPIQQVVLRAYDGAGADSAEALYRALRDRYLTQGSYDFGEVPLSDVGAALLRRGLSADAVRFHRLNTVLNPGSGFAFRQLAGVYLSLRDTAAAIAALEGALGVNSADPQARRALDALRGGR